MRGLTKNTTVHIFVDGTYQISRNTYKQGYAFVVFDSTMKAIIYQKAEPLFNTPYQTATNCSSELMAAIKAVRWAEKQGYTCINLYSDYTGVQSLLGEQHQNHRHALFQFFHRFMVKRTNYRKNAVKVFLHKVPSHAGNFGNNIADKLARSILLQNQETTWWSLFKRWASIATHSLNYLEFEERWLRKGGLA
jgi:ribonuclease HI